MAEAASIREVYLEPGDFCFGEGHLRITTVLGSCVSISIWHPLLHHGGMCHFMLPQRKIPGQKLEGKYGDEAMQMFMDEIRKRRMMPGQYQVQLFGGGKMFDTQSSEQDIGRQNVDQARRLLDQHGFTVISEHVGGFGRRRLAFDVWSGRVRVEQIDHRGK